MGLFLLFACTGGDDRSPDTDSGGDCTTAPATVEIGGGSTAFEPVADGAEVTMVHGPQGGWHVLASVLLHNVDPIVSIHYTITVDDIVVIADNTYRVQILPDGPCGGTYPGMYGYLDVRALADGDRDTPPELLAGRELLLGIDITDLGGRTASDTLSAIAALDPMDEPEDTAAP